MSNKLLNKRLSNTKKHNKVQFVSWVRSTLLFLIFLASASQVYGQAASPPDSMATTSLYGRVVLEGYPVRNVSDNWFVCIWVQFKENLKILPRRDSNRDLYCYKIQPGPQVRLIFWTNGYDRMATNWFPANNPYSLAVSEVMLSHHGQHRRIAFSADWRQELDGQLELAKATHFYDIMAWNLAEAIYNAQNNPTLHAVLDNYSTEVQSQAGMPSDFQEKQSLYSSIIAYNSGANGAVNVPAVLSLAQAQGTSRNTFAGIQAAAIACLANVSTRSGLEPALKLQFADFLRAQTSNSADLLFRPATSALIKAGTQTDRERIIQDVHSGDPERAEAAIVALRKADLPEGREAIDEVAKDDDADPNVRSVATASIGQAAGDQGTTPTVSMHRKYILRDGSLMAGFEMHTITPIDMNPWFRRTDDGTLELDYPANQQYGLLQIMVSQPDAQRHMLDVSAYSDLVVELKSTEPGKSVDIGVKGFDDPVTKTLDKKTLPNVSTDYQEYHFSLTDRDTERLKRLETLKIVTELAFGGAESQQFSVRNIYFAGP